MPVVHMWITMGAPNVPPNWLRRKRGRSMPPRLANQSLALSLSLRRNSKSAEVHVVGAGLGDHVEDAAGGAAVLRTEGVGLDPKLLHGIHAGDRGSADSATRPYSGRRPRYSFWLPRCPLMETEAVLIMSTGRSFMPTEVRTPGARPASA